MRWGIYKRGGYTLYLVDGMLFKECEDTYIDVETDDIVDWGDHKCYINGSMDGRKNLKKEKMN